MGREDKELSVTGSLGGIKPAKGAKGARARKRGGGAAQRTQEHKEEGMVPLSAQA